MEIGVGFKVSMLGLIDDRVEYSACPKTIHKFFIKFNSKFSKVG